MSHMLVQPFRYAHAKYFSQSASIVSLKLFFKVDLACGAASRAHERVNI